MMTRPSCRISAGVLALLVLSLVQAPPATAQQADAAADDDRRLVVAVRHVPPFAMRDAAGNWEGLSVELWQDVADKLNVNFEWRELPLEATIEAIERGDADVAIAAISVTAERERSLDFSHPYYVTGLARAFADDSGSAWTETLRAFFSFEFLSAVSSLAVVLLAAGFLIWLFERKANAEEFGHGDVGRGLGDGFWWSAVTMTTVGYGDKAPKTVGGRVVALVWMFLSLIIIASFTASIAASLTTNELTASLSRERPLSDLRVGVLAGSASEEYSRRRGARVRSHDSVEDAISALLANEVETVVHDAPILRHAIRESGLPASVDDRILVRDDYAFAFPEGSEHRNDVNLALLSILLEPTWQSIRARYLGEISD